MTHRLRPTLMLLAAALAALAVAAVPAQAARPQITAPSAIVVDATTGDVAYAKAPDQRRPIASTTKLMTALVAVEAGHLSDVVSAARYRPAPAESVIGLQTGERITEADLLRGLLVYSANDAAVSIATHLGGGSVSSFVRLMNRRAQELGLKNTHYANPIGLDDPANYSTARDLATLASVLRHNRFIRRTVDSQQVTLKSGAHQRVLNNRNTLLGEAPWVDGMKTGHTSLAGNLLVASAHRHGVRLISVVMDEPTKDASNHDSLALLRYGFGRYHRVRAVVRGDVVARVPIDHRAGAVLPLVASTTVHRVLRRGERFGYHTSVPRSVDGPIHYGQRLGKLVIEMRGKPVRSVALTAALDVPKASVARRTQDALTTPWTLVVFAGVLGVLAGLSRVRRRPPPREPRPSRTAEELDPA